MPSEPQPDAEPDETCALCGKPAPEGNVEHDDDGEVMHPKCRADAAAQPDADGWIPWEGGDVCPVAHGWVGVKHRSGWCGKRLVEVCRWEHTGDEYDIIAYRLVTPAKDPAQMDTDQIARLGAHVAKDEPVDPPKSLRDEFAMTALPAVIVATSAGQHNVMFRKGLPKDAKIELAIAVSAYDVADAMMAARRHSDALRVGEVGE